MLPNLFLRCLEGGVAVVDRWPVGQQLYQMWCMRVPEDEAGAMPKVHDRGLGKDASEARSTFRIPGCTARARGKVGGGR